MATERRSDLGGDEECKANLGKNTLKRSRLFSKSLLDTRYWKVYSFNSRAIFQTMQKESRSRDINIPKT